MKLPLPFVRLGAVVLRKAATARNLLVSRYQGSLLGEADTHLEHPVEITGHRFIRTPGFHAREGLRINLFTEHFGKLGSPSLTIGRGVRFERNVHIGVIGEVVIEDGVLVGSNVVIMDHNHGCYSGAEADSDPDEPPFRRRLSSNGSIRICENAWIGDGAVILGGARIGRGAVVGANAVVAGEVPDGTVVVGPKALPVRRWEPEEGRWIRVSGKPGTPAA